MIDPLSALEDPSAYGRLFTDVALWTPYVMEVCQRHALEPCHEIRIGVPGSFPAFIVSERWLVKFFGRLYAGGPSFLIEQEASRLTALDPAIPTAGVVASGRLRETDWPWPYLVYTFIPGRSTGELMDQIRQEDRLRIACDMGDIIRRLHALPIQGSAVFPNQHGPYLRFLQEQRAACVTKQRAWGSLPAHLIEQIPGFLPPLEQLARMDHAPHLIHADLTRDHLLGKVENGRWSTLALIDFGDARTGSLYYELAALHIDLFGADQKMLSAFLDVYGINPAERAYLPRMTLATCLLHQFNMFGMLNEEQRSVSTLEALAKILFGEIPRR